MPTPRKHTKKPAALDPAQLNNEQVLRQREERIEAARQAIPDLDLRIPEAAPASAAEFLRDEWDRKTFGDAPETISRIVYGPDPLFDGSSLLKAGIEKVGLHDYADATAGLILKVGEMALPDPLLRAGFKRAISQFGVEKVAEAFRDRILRIPCRTVEYEVDHGDFEVEGSKVLDEAVARYGRPGMAYKFLSDRCCGVLGKRGYEIVKDEKGDPVRIGQSLMMGEIPLRVAERRRQRQHELATEAVENEVQKYQEEAERLAIASKMAGVRPLLRDELMTANASETEGSVGQQRSAGFSIEKEFAANV